VILVTLKQKRLDAELARLETLVPAGLRQAWLDLEGSAAPNLGAALLRRLLAQRLQERRLGGLLAVITRELERVAAGPATAGGSPPRVSLTPGARLIREWNGRTIAVEVTEDGFLWEGLVRRSLSEIAREVTGAHWSGPRFFGLRRNG
jgi:Protein of unknown function (DUF2924)